MTPSAIFSRVSLPIMPCTWVQRWLGTPVYWAIQLPLWLLLSVISDYIACLASRQEFDGRALVSALGFALEMLVATHLSRLILLGLWQRRRSARFLLAAAGGCLVLSGAVTALIGTGLAWLLLDAPPFSVDAFHNALWLFYIGFEYSIIWIACYLGLLLFRSLHEVESARLSADAAAKEAELIALKTQLNPHFLFNALNTLRSLLPREQNLPREAITTLADLLRAALAVQALPTIQLRRELATVDAYLSLEQLRLEERLSVRRDIDPGALDCHVPPFSVQGLVENAVKFGISPRANGGEIVLSAAVREGMLQLRVTNPGRIAETSGSTGVGLKNTRARLRHLYGDRASCTLSQLEPDLVAADLNLPCTP